MLKGHLNMSVAALLGLISVVGYHHYRVPSTASRGFAETGHQTVVNKGVTLFPVQLAELNEMPKAQIITIETHTSSSCSGYPLTASSVGAGISYMQIVPKVILLDGAEGNSELASGTAVQKADDSGTGISDEPGRMIFKCYPNPLQDEGRIEIENYNNEPYTVEFFNLEGKLIKRQAGNNTNVFIIAGADMSPGIYIYRICSTGGAVLHSSKLIIQ